MDADYFPDLDPEPRPRRWQHWCRECWGATSGGSPCAPREPDTTDDDQPDTADDE